MSNYTDSLNQIIKIYLEQIDPSNKPNRFREDFKKYEKLAGLNLWNDFFLNRKIKHELKKSLIDVAKENDALVYIKIGKFKMIKTNKIHTDCDKTTMEIIDAALTRTADCIADFYRGKIVRKNSKDDNVEKTVGGVINKIEDNRIFYKLIQDLKKELRKQASKEGINIIFEDYAIIDNYEISRILRDDLINKGRQLFDESDLKDIDVNNANAVVKLFSNAIDNLLIECREDFIRHLNKAYYQYSSNVLLTIGERSFLKDNVTAHFYNSANVLLEEIENIDFSEEATDRNEKL